MSASELHAHLLCRGFSLRVEDGRLIVSPASELTDSDRDAIRAHRDALVKAVDSVPSGCLAPVICGQVGICGRIACIVPEERSRFVEAVQVARASDNPHRVPDEYLDDISEGGAAA